MSDPVQQIKDRLNIVDVIGQYVKLTKAGRNYKGLSPFKKEKTPSFYVNPDKGMYYDFSSNQGGDVFTFIETVEGLDFKGALQMLAERAGVEVRHESRLAKTVRERMYAVMEDACRFYETKFAEQIDARTYLQSRGLEPATMRSFRIGFAPDDWQVLRDHLTKAGYTERELELAGLTKRADTGSSYYDRFRSRIMFPISDPAGRIIAFSGRVFGEAAQDEKNAKYLNSPETELFDKGRILYGYDKAKQYIRKYDCSILVEGQMDIVMSHQAGYTNTVAVSGTALTDEHLALLNRLSTNVVLAFDADSAGVASTGRAAALALSRGMDVKVAQVLTGKDPADCIKEGVELWKEAVRDAKHVVDFFIDLVNRESHGDPRKRSLRIRDTVLPYVARIKSGVDQAHFVRRVAEELGLAEDAVWQDVRTHARAIAREESTAGTHAHEPSHTLPETPRTKREELERELAGFLYWQNSLEKKQLSDASVEACAKEFDVDPSGALARYDGERDVLALRTELMHEKNSDAEGLLRTLFSALAFEALQEERATLTRTLRDAERAQDADTVERILARHRELSRRIENLDTRA